jgi:hypothetical protein
MSAYSTMLPAYITAACVQLQLNTPRSWVMNRSVVPLAVLSSFRSATI